jgi:hypothetical protein
MFVDRAHTSPGHGYFRSKSYSKALNVPTRGYSTIETTQGPSCCVSQPKILWVPAILETFGSTSIGYATFEFVFEDGKRPMKVLRSCLQRKLEPWIMKNVHTEEPMILLEGMNHLLASHAHVKGDVNVQVKQEGQVVIRHESLGYGSVSPT